MGAVVVEFEELLAQPELLQNRVIATDEFIQKCMAERGFEFVVPEVPSIDELVKGMRLPGWELLAMTEEEARESGLGIVAQLPSDTEQQPYQAPDRDGHPDLVSSEEFAWEVAMWGFSTDNGADQHYHETIPDRENTGCFWLAASVIGPVSVGQALERVASTESEIERWARFISDVQVLDVGDRWAACMRNRAYDSIPPDPFAIESLHFYFWENLAPIALGRPVTPEERFSVDDSEVYDSLHQVEQTLALDYVRCIAPHRELLKENWIEHLGFNPPG